MMIAPSHQLTHTLLVGRLRTTAGDTAPERLRAPEPAAVHLRPAVLQRSVVLRPGGQLRRQSAAAAGGLRRPATPAAELRGSGRARRIQPTTTE